MQKILYPLLQKSTNFCLLPMKKESQKNYQKMEKNEEPLAEEREELKYILPEAKSIKMYRG